MQKTAEQLASELRNVGEKSAQRLLNIGVDSWEVLERRGTEEVFLNLHEAGELCHTFNAAYLYALEGAILDCDWREISPDRKDQFKEFTRMLRAGA